MPCNAPATMPSIWPNSGPTPRSSWSSMARPCPPPLSTVTLPMPVCACAKTACCVLSSRRQSIYGLSPQRWSGLSSASNKVGTTSVHEHDSGPLRACRLAPICVIIVSNSVQFKTRQETGSPLMSRLLTVAVLAAFSFAAAAETTTPAPEPTLQIAQVIEVEEQAIETEQYETQPAAAPGAAAGGIGATGINTPVAAGVVGAAALIAIVAAGSSSGGSSSSHSH